MNDYKIVIDAGHGGSDRGAVGNGIVEKDLNLLISEYMYNRLNELGIPVKMTRTTDETVSPNERVRRVLEAFENRNDVIVISNHINAGGGDGAEVIYAKRNNNVLSNLILDELSKEGQNIRKSFQRSSTTNPNQDYYFIHRQTGNTQPVIVEYGFLDSSKDDVNQLKNNYQNYAEATTRALLKYIGAPEQPSSEENAYIVKSGDSLWSIAKKFNVNLDQLKGANNLTSNLLRVGQILKIPMIIEEPTNAQKYIVQSGDTLYKIANQFETTTDDLININQLATTNLNIGDELLIPFIEETSEYTVYQIEPGDSLYGIAKQNNITMDELIRYNNLNTPLLQIGQQIRIPKTVTSETSEIEYIVKSGDNLYTIANRYNTTVDDIMNYNNLKSNLLTIGQVLQIPNNNNIYIVKSGDNLYKIANQYGTTADEIKRKNNLNSNNIVVGQVLTI